MGVYERVLENKKHESNKNVSLFITLQLFDSCFLFSTPEHVHKSSSS